MIPGIDSPVVKHSAEFAYVRSKDRVDFVLGFLTVMLAMIAFISFLSLRQIVVNESLDRKPQESRQTDRAIDPLLAPSEYKLAEKSKP